MRHPSVSKVLKSLWRILELKMASSLSLRNGPVLVTLSHADIGREKLMRGNFSANDMMHLYWRELIFASSV